MASSNVHWWGLSDSFNVFWLKAKYYLSMVPLPAFQSNGWWERNILKMFWRNFRANLFPFPVLYHNILVKLRSILGPEKSGIAFWLFIWPYVLMFQWLPLYKISLEWSDQCLRAFQSHNNRSRLLRPDEDCEIIQADLLYNAGCRQLELNVHLFSLSINAVAEWAHQPKAGGGFLCARRATSEPPNSPRLSMPSHAGVSIHKHLKKTQRY